MVRRTRTAGLGVEPYPPNQERITVFAPTAVELGHLSQFATRASHDSADPLLRTLGRALVSSRMGFPEPRAQGVARSLGNGGCGLHPLLQRGRPHISLSRHPRSVFPIPRANLAAA